MITRETAADIWECHREIATAEKLLADMAQEREANRFEPQHEPTLKDAFGRRQQMQLGVPSGHASHRWFGVSAKLAESVIRAHIADKQAALVRANEQARIELDQDPKPTECPNDDRR
jgi:hypothetical protein